MNSTAFMVSPIKNALSELVNNGLCDLNEHPSIPILLVLDMHVDSSFGCLCHFFAFQHYGVVQARVNNIYLHL